LLAHTHQSDTALAALTAKIQARTARVGIIGLGYVGLPLAIRFVDEGFPVVGFDVDRRKVDAINERRSYIKHIGDEQIARLVDGGMRPTTDFALAGEVDALIICVPTPLNRNREPDLSYVVGSLQSLLPHLRRGQILSLESTTYPGTTDEVLRPAIEERGFKLGEDFFLVFSPEREDPGNPDFSTKTIPKVVGGSTPACLAAGVALYQEAVDRVVPVRSASAAEMVKLLENIHRAVNIGLVNEMKMVADRMGIDIHEVIEAAATKPFGFAKYKPGPGLGGHCIPIDPFYLSWKAREFGIVPRFIELAGEINEGMPDYVAGKVVDSLNGACKPVNGSRILILGVAYKKNIDDMRESPSLRLMRVLAAKGAHLEYADPYIPELTPGHEHAFTLTAIAPTPAVLASFDCVVVATDHDGFDYAQIAANAPLIVDSRGVFSQAAAHIVMA
jgi:UDP-N-acetyl-D-glucosamine dehydrogenase